jgi:hypothetical protein
MEAHPKRANRDLDTCAAELVSQQNISDSESQLVHSPGDRNADSPEAIASQILDRGQGSTT